MYNNNLKKKMLPMFKKMAVIAVSVFSCLLLVTCGSDNSTGPSNTGNLGVTVFTFQDSTNNAISADMVGSLSDTGVVVNLPIGTNVTALVATFEAATGDTVKVNNVVQVSGVTANDFTNPVTYTVVSSSGSTKTFTVTVKLVAAGSGADAQITSFSFQSALNSGLTADVSGVIRAPYITLTVPAGTNITNLVATFVSTGDTVKVGNTIQQSSLTANNFTNSVTYTVIGDSSSRSYIVKVATGTVTPDSSKDITAYSFLASKNTTLSANVAATITGTAITATVPSTANVSALVASFTTTGNSVKVGTVEQQSGITANNFTTAVTYTVTAVNGTTKTYTVTVTKEATASDTSKALTAFSFLASKNATLSSNVAATITGSTITAAVPSGTNVTALIANFTTTGDSVKVGTVIQESGTTANNFTNAVTYTVIAGNGTSRAYTVTVTKSGGDSLKSLTSFSFLSSKNATLTSNVTATISGTTIAATVPSTTDVTALIATFTTTGSNVKVGNAVQVSGTTANNFTNPVVYIVTAGNGTTQNYTVTITKESGFSISQFSFTANKNPALSATVTAMIVDSSIRATLPAGTAVTSLIATFTTTADSVKVGTALQVSGTTANNFTNPVTYTAYSGSTTKNYVASVVFSVDTIAIKGTWKTAARDTFTMVVGLDSIKVQGKADTSLAYINYQSNSDSICVAKWIVNAAATKPYQKMKWRFLSATQMALSWYNYKANNSSALAETTPTAVDTLVKQ